MSAAGAQQHTGEAPPLPLSHTHHSTLNQSRDRRQLRGHPVLASSCLLSLSSEANEVSCSAAAGVRLKLHEHAFDQDQGHMTRFFSVVTHQGCSPSMKLCGSSGGGRWRKVVLITAEAGLTSSTISSGSRHSSAEPRRLKHVFSPFLLPPEL